MPSSLHVKTREANMTKKAGIAIDNWKLSIFRKHLDTAGFKYKAPQPFTRTTTLLQVEYEHKHLLNIPIIKATRECEKRKANNTICLCGCYSGGCGRPDGCRCTKECPCGASTKPVEETKGIRPTTLDPTRSWAEQMNASSDKLT